MKVTYISDIHTELVTALDIQQWCELIITLVREKETDLLAILGDINYGMEYTIEFLNILKLAIPETRIVFVPGNYDLSRYPEFHKSSTGALLQKYLDSEYNIIQNHIELNSDTVLIGTLGWFDFSIESELLTEEYNRYVCRNEAQVYAKDNYADETWILNIDLPLGGITFHDYYMNETLCYIEYLSKRYKNIIVVSHYPISNFCIDKSLKKEITKPGYCGSLTLGKALSKLSHVKEFYHGHIHSGIRDWYRVGHIRCKSVCIAPYGETDVVNIYKLMSKVSLTVDY